MSPDVLEVRYVRVRVPSMRCACPERFRIVGKGKKPFVRCVRHNHSAGHGGPGPCEPHEHREP